MLNGFLYPVSAKVQWLIIYQYTYSWSASIADIEYTYTEREYQIRDI